ADAMKGLELAREGGFDLAIVDVRLPGAMSGLDLVPALRAASPSIEVILVTGNATVDTAIAAVRHGIFAYVLKPFDPSDLLTLAERALAQVALRRDRERLSVELEASEALYRGVVDTVGALIVGVDAEGRISLFNRLAQKLSGLSAEVACGRSFVETCVAESERPAMVSAIATAMRGEEVRELELKLPILEGDARDLRWTLTRLEPRGATSTALLCLGHDVTETLELQRRTVESEAMAAMGALTTGLAHEIRNPLNAAALQLEALLRTGRKLEDGPTKEQLAKRVSVVKSELSRLSTMLNEFLSYAHPRGLALRPVDISATIREIVHLKTPLAEELGFTIESNLCEPGCTVLADQDKLKQVLLNLIANAFEAMREQSGGGVTITVRPDGRGFIEVSVLDEGPGLAE
ncbi:MAG: response regulator, partial [Polyangiaceae bacterium]|nr:response regulator [Polyangiaceae bacterium]